MEKIVYKAILSKIQKEILNNKNELKEMEKIDAKYCKIKFDINELLKIIEIYKEKNIENISTKITYICNGNPYIVLNLAMVAIIKNISIEINIDNTMFGVNKYILETINNILHKNKINTEIRLTENIEGEKLVFIDRINDFNIAKKGNAMFVPYQSIDIYSDNEECEELYEKIYNYAMDMNIDIDTFDDEGIETMLKYGKGNKKLILTNREEIKDKYKNENIYINENPFKDEELIFDNELIKKIIC